MNVMSNETKVPAKKKVAKKAVSKTVTAKKVAAPRAKANTKARQVRALIRRSRTTDPIKLMQKVRDSDIGVPEANIRGYILVNLPRVLAEKDGKAA